MSAKHQLVGKDGEGLSVFHIESFYGAVRLRVHCKAPEDDEDLRPSAHVIVNSRLEYKASELKKCLGGKLHPW